MTAMALRMTAMALAAVLILEWALEHPTPALADPTGVISGRVVNKTAAGGSVAGAEVRLVVFRNEGQQAERVATTGPDGSFRFDGLETAADYAYQVMTLYSGLPYGTGSITFSGEERHKSAQLEVYEATQENPGIYVESASLIIAGADPETESILALEIVEMVNPSDRTFRPTPGGPQGPMGLVRFSLPPGATDLTAHMGMAQEEIIQVNRGFATLAPIPPGSREFMYAYRFPYKDGQVSFSKNLLFGAKVFTLLTVEGAGEVSSPQLALKERAEIQGRKYLHLQGNDLAPNTAIQVSLNGLPQRSGVRLPFGEASPVAWAGTGVLLALATMAVVVLRRPALAPGAASQEGSVPALEIQELLEALADLDDRHAAGRIEDEAWQGQRSVLRDQLKALVREHDIHLVKEQAGVHEEPDRAQ